MQAIILKKKVVDLSVAQRWRVIRRSDPEKIPAISHQALDCCYWTIGAIKAMQIGFGTWMASCRVRGILYFDRAQSFDTGGYSPAPGAFPQFH